MTLRPTAIVCEPSRPNPSNPNSGRTPPPRRRRCAKPTPLKRCFKNTIGWNRRFLIWVPWTSCAVRPAAKPNGPNWPGASRISKPAWKTWCFAPSCRGPWTPKTPSSLSTLARGGPNRAIGRKCSFGCTPAGRKKMGFPLKSLRSCRGKAPGLNGRKSWSRASTRTAT